eukprot:5722919-Prymnesium_polylepis.1
MPGVVATHPWVRRAYSATMRMQMLQELIWADGDWRERGLGGGLRGLILRGQWVLPTPAAGE